MGKESSSKLFDSLPKNKSLSKLNVWANDFSHSFSQLSSSISQLETLTELNLMGCSLGQDGCESLSKGLLSSTSLKYLNISGIFFYFLILLFIYLFFFLLFHFLFLFFIFYFLFLFSIFYFIIFLFIYLIFNFNFSISFYYFFYIYFYFIFIFIFYFLFLFIFW